MEDLKALLEDPKKQTVHVPENMENAINVMVVLLKLEESDGAAAFIEKRNNFIKEIENTKEIPLEALFNALKKVILKIEISSTLGKQLLYFPQHPILTKLSDTTRDRIMLEVSRSTQREKIKSLLQFKEEVKMEISHNFNIEKEKFLGIQISPAKIQKLQDLLFNLSYLIIFVWSMTTDVIIEYGEVEYSSPFYILPVMLGLDLLQLGTTALYAILYYKCKFVLADYRAKKKKEQE